MSGSDIIDWSAGRTAAAIREGALSGREAVEQHLAWMARVNPALNAVTVDLSDAARAAAERADARGHCVGDRARRALICDKPLTCGRPLVLGH